MNGRLRFAIGTFVLLSSAAVVLLHYFEYGLLGLISIAGIVLAYPVSEALHELGHLLFGATVKIKAVPKFSLTGSSSCKIIPKTDKNLKKRVIFTALGGLIVNGLLIILGIVAFSVNAVPIWLSLPLPSSVYILCLNSVPFITRSGKTDGLVISELLKDSDEAKVTLAVLAVQAQILNGKPIGEVDESLLFSVPQIREDDAGFISLTELRYEYFKAKGDTEKAQFYKTRFDELKNEYL